MAIKKGGLGRGFESLFADNSTEDLSPQSVSILPIGEIEPNREQPRKNFDSESLAELSQSIRENGVLQPILVRPLADGGYKIVAGERRYRAAMDAGLFEIPVVVRALSDEEAALIAMIENLQREDLNPFEEAEGMKDLIERFGFTQQDLADRLGKSRPAVANSLRLLAVPEKIRQMVENQELTAGHARALLSLEDEEKMLRYAEEVVHRDLSVRETEALVKKGLKEKKNPREKTKKPHSDNYFTEVELSMTKTMGRAVEIKEGKKGGKLIIEYFDKEDLGKIARKLED